MALSNLVRVRVRVGVGELGLGLGVGLGLGLGLGLEVALSNWAAWPSTISAWMVVARLVECAQRKSACS